MSDFTTKETARLKKAIEARRVKDEKSVQEHNLKQTEGLHFGERTRDAAQHMVEQLNEGVGHNLLVWRSPNTAEINVIAAEVSSQHSLVARFDPDTYRVSWIVASSNRSNLVMTLTVINSELMWNVGGTTYTEQQAAERLIRDLTETI
jgi:hypothetical protein